MTSCIVFCILLLKYRKYSMYFGQSILNTLTIKYFKNTVLNASGSVTLASAALQIGLLLLLLLNFKGSILKSILNTLSKVFSPSLFGCLRQVVQVHAVPYDYEVKFSNGRRTDPCVTPNGNG